MLVGSISSAWSYPSLFLAVVLVCHLEFLQNFLEYLEGTNFMSPWKCVCVCSRESEGQREWRTPCSAKTFRNTAGSVCPVLFIKVVVLRPSAHTHGLRGLSYGSCMVPVLPLSKTFLELRESVFWTCAVPWIKSPDSWHPHWAACQYLSMTYGFLLFGSLQSSFHNFTFQWPITKRSMLLHVGFEHSECTFLYINTHLVSFPLELMH